MKKIPDSQKYIIADDNSYPSGFHCPNPRGWYHSVGNVVSTPDGLVAVYRLSDSHCAVYVHIMVAYSQDGGKTWSGHRSIAHRNVWEHHSVWVAPQLSRLRDGRLVVICDLGHRTSHDDWPKLSLWQKRPPRGMANYLLWSEDNGKTWSDPVKCDDVGGEPSYIVELSDGTLVYTRTDSAVTDRIENPPEPWGNVYYRNTAVFSDDGGRTWDRTSIITDAPFHGDCEVGIVELEPGCLLAVTRIGFAGGQLGQPSRLVHSHDNGKTWEKPVLAPFYGQRPAVYKLQSGKLMVTYRNRWGTFASYAFVWDPAEELQFEPASFIWDESRCTLNDGVMTLNTDEGGEGQAYFSLYPVMDSRSRVDLDVELRLEGAGSGGCDIYAGCLLRFTPQGIFLPERFQQNAAVDATGVALDDTVPHASEEGIEVDTTQWRRYKIIREAGELRLYFDGQLKLQRPVTGIESRLVRFGSNLKGVSHWKWVSAKIDNPDDYSIDWSWRAADGFPDRFRRDRMVVMDHTSDSGYSNWTQIDDGTIVIADYSNDSYINASWSAGPQPVLKAYVVREEDLIEGWE